MGNAHVLMIHHVTPEPESVWEVSPARLGDYLRKLLDDGVRFSGMNDVLQESGELAVVTFDDAYENVYRNAFPLLSNLGIPATVYVPVDCVGGSNTFDKFFAVGLGREERIMNWPHLQELAGAGWEIQSHGCSHLPLPALDTARLQEELIRSKNEIEDRTKNQVTSFCYPFGLMPFLEFGELLRAAGYDTAVLAGGGPAKTPPRDPYRIPRVFVTGIDTEEEEAA